MFLGIKIKYFHISSPLGYPQFECRAACLLAAMLPGKRCPLTLQMGWVLLVWIQTQQLCSAGSFFFSQPFGAQTLTWWKPPGRCPKLASPVVALVVCQPPGPSPEPCSHAEWPRSSPARTQLSEEHLPTPASSASQKHLTWARGRSRKRWIGAICLCSFERVLKCMSGGVAFFKRVVKPLCFLPWFCWAGRSGENSSKRVILV